MKAIIFITLLVLLATQIAFSQRIFSDRPETETQPSAQTAVQAQPSSLSMWVGAVMAYNFEEDQGAENVVGAGKVILGRVKQFEGEGRNFHLLVVGNLAKISASLNEEDVTQSLTNLVQSSQGISIAISPTLSKPLGNNNFLRFWGSAGGKFNAFSDVGVDEKDVTLSQFRLSAGIEFEGFEIDSGTGAFNLSLEYSYSLFDKEKYAQVFTEERSYYTGLEVMLIIPIGNNFGVMGSVVLSEKTNPLVQAGIIVKR